MAQTIGLVQISWRGVDIPIAKGATIKLGGLKNNVVINGQGAARAQEFEASEITATTSLYKDQRYTSLFDVEEGELIVTCDTGQSYTFADAFLTDIPNFKGDGTGGELELKWAAGLWTEVIG